jgi:hypothetical protein
MSTGIPLILTVLIFPMSFLGTKLRTHRYGFAVPLFFAALLLAATLMNGDPPLPALFFVVLAIGIAWRW